MADTSAPFSLTSRLIAELFGTFVLVLFVVPLADTAWVVVRRARAGAPILRGDRGHLTHTLALRLGPARAVAAIVAAAAAAAAAAATVPASGPSGPRIAAGLGAAIAALLVAAALRSAARPT